MWLTVSDSSSLTLLSPPSLPYLVQPLCVLRYLIENLEAFLGSLHNYITKKLRYNTLYNIMLL